MFLISDKKYIYYIYEPNIDLTTAFNYGVRINYNFFFHQGIKVK